MVARWEEVPANAYHVILRTMLVDELAVVPEARRAGVGQLLMAAVTQAAKRRGAHRVELDVRAHNHGAQRFYESLGFMPQSTRMSLDIKPEPEPEPEPDPDGVF